jgi:uncharacterized membrane protein
MPSPKLALFAAIAMKMRLRFVPALSEWAKMIFLHRKSFGFRKVSENSSKISH